MGLAERMRTTRYFHELVMSKIEGRISQAELERRTREFNSEQLSLGIGAGEVPRMGSTTEARRHGERQDAA
jgi:hypothetical protein